jgi:hypothetical protein
MLAEVIEQSSEDSDEPKQNEDLTALRTRIAASIACHSAIKVNTPLDPARMEWLLLELAKTSHPTSCPHGRPIALLYSWKEIQRAFHRILEQVEGGSPPLRVRAARRLNASLEVRFFFDSRAIGSIARRKDAPERTRGTHTGGRPDVD